MLYFDHNATHPLSRVAREAWLDATERYIGNPSSLHRLGVRADLALEQAREKLAGWLGCDPHQIVWTSGATEANNAVLHHAAGSEGHAWISAIEHPCVIEGARRYFPGRHELMPVTPDGSLDLAWLVDALATKIPRLVGMMAANNETGVFQPWREVRDHCSEYGVPFFCDAAQWVGRMAAAGLGECDFVSGCAHKFGGPQGVGFLKVPANFCPLIVGGAQEDGRRAGTENVAGVLGMIAALEEREAALTAERIRARVGERTAFEETLRATIPAVEIVGGTADRLWNTVLAVMPEVPDCRQRWVVKLDKLGFAVSAGSACASGEERTSHVLVAMGVAPEAAGRALRFSGGWDTRPEDWSSLRSGIEQAFFEMNGSR